MPRAIGTRNVDYASKRSKLVDTLTDTILSSDQFKRPSLRLLAQSAGVTEPTLKHYFGSREALITEIIKACAARAKPFWNSIAAPPIDVGSAIDAYFTMSQLGIADGGFARAHIFGFVEGLADTEVAKVYLLELLEPAIAVLETRLKPVLDKNISTERLRAAALIMFSPMLIAVLHQQSFGGSEIKPMHLNAVLDQMANLTKSGLMQ